MTERLIEGSILAEYLEYTSGQESPECFHTWVCLVMLASILDRQVFLNRGTFTVYPNLYTFLIAGTAKCHKSTAINIGKRLIDDMKKDPRSKEVPRTFAQKITNERLIQFLGEGAELAESSTKIRFKASGLITASELSTFMGANAMNSGLLASLVDLYDCEEEWDYETKGAGKDKLYNVYINMLGASTEKWLRAAIPVEAVGGGIMSRTIFVYADKPKRLIPFPEDEIPDNFEDIKDRLINDLIHIQSLKGEFQFTPDAKDYYEEWYIENAEESMKNTAHADFFSRWDNFLVKLGMLVSVSRKDELVIDRTDLKMADSMLQGVKENMKPVIDTMIVSNGQLPTARVLDMLRRRDSLTHKSLMNMTRSFCSADDLREITDTLCQAECIEAVRTNQGTTMYKFLTDGM